MTGARGKKSLCRARFAREIPFQKAKASKAPPKRSIYRHTHTEGKTYSGTPIYKHSILTKPTLNFTLRSINILSPSSNIITTVSGKNMRPNAAGDPFMFLPTVGLYRPSSLSRVLLHHSMDCWKLVIYADD